MEPAITWRWQDGGRGVLAHAGLEDALETLCGAPASGAPIFHPPWFEMRCQACEKLRAGRMEVFHNPLAQLLDNQARIEEAFPPDPNEA